MRGPVALAAPLEDELSPAMSERQLSASARTPSSPSMRSTTDLADLDTSRRPLSTVTCRRVSVATALAAV